MVRIYILFLVYVEIYITLIYILDMCEVRHTGLEMEIRNIPLSYIV